MSGELARPGFASELREWLSLTESEAGRERLIELQILEAVVKKLDRIVDQVRLSVWDDSSELEGVVSFLLSATVFPSVAARAKQELVVDSLVHVLKGLERRRPASVTAEQVGQLSDSIATIMANIAGGTAKTANNGRPYDVDFDGLAVTICPMGFASANVGWKVWDSAILLANWVLSDAGRRRIANAHVLELGCGVALTGLVAAKLDAAASVVLTDYLPAIVSNTERAIELNSVGARTTARCLDWLDLSTPDMATWQERFAVILAADCVYGPEALSITDVVAHCLSPGGIFIAISAIEHHSLVPGFEASLRARHPSLFVSSVPADLYSRHISGTEQGHTLFVIEK